MKEKIYNLVAHLYHKHDLSINFYNGEIDCITDICLEEIKEYPDIEITEFFIMQTILENFCTL